MHNTKIIYIANFKEELNRTDAANLYEVYCIVLTIAIRYKSLDKSRLNQEFDLLSSEIFLIIFNCFVHRDLYIR